MKYTKESLRVICDCKSVREAIVKLGLKAGSGNKRLHKLIKEVLIESGDYNPTRLGRKSPIKKNEEFFKNDPTCNRTSWAVRNALFDRGLKEKMCECCGNTRWFDNEIPLEVHHINGDKFDNELSNLQILCPNCHYFTDTYKSKNIK